MQLRMEHLDLSLKFDGNHICIFPKNKCFPVGTCEVREIDIPVPLRMNKQLPKPENADWTSKDAELCRVRNLRRCSLRRLGACEHRKKSKIMRFRIFLTISDYRSTHHRTVPKNCRWWFWIHFCGIIFAQVRTSAHLHTDLGASTRSCCSSCGSCGSWIPPGSSQLHPWFSMASEPKHYLQDRWGRLQPEFNARLNISRRSQNLHCKRLMVASVLICV